MTENFPKINLKHKTIHPGSSENTRQDKFKKLYLGISCSKCRMPKRKKNLESSQRKRQLTYREVKIRITFNFSETMQATTE